jgi:hypothetical protein
VTVAFGFLLMLVAGLIVSLSLWQRSSRERDHALASEKLAEDRLGEAMAPFTRNGIPFKQLVAQGIVTPSCSLASGRPKTIFSRMVAAKSVVSCKTMPIWRRLLRQTTAWALHRGISEPVK